MAQHLGCCRVTQDVGAFSRAHDTSPLHRASHRGGYAVASLEWSIRSNISNVRVPVNREHRFRLIVNIQSS